MDFVHCNQCFVRNSADGFLISSCFHIFCLNCAKLEDTTCPLCSKKIKIVRLDGNISPNVKVYFADPLKTLTDNLAKFQRKIDFQENIRVHLLKHLIKEKEKKRQMEVYFRKKGQEFESQKKKLAEANAWIQTAEKKLQSCEEERQLAEREMQELQEKIKSLSTTALSHTKPVKPTTPFSFIMEDSQQPAISMATSIVESSANSTFNLVSPFVSSPAHSLNSSNFHAFFEAEEASATGTEAFNGDLEFNTLSSGQSVVANTSNSSAFSVAFNNMFTPTRTMNTTSRSMADQTVVNQTIMDKTSASLDNWRARESNSFGSHNASKRDSSLPTRSAITPSSLHLHSLKNSRIVPPSSKHRQSVTGGIDRQKVRDMRRISSQPGYLAQRRSINHRSNFLKPGE